VISSDVGSLVNDSNTNFTSCYASLTGSMIFTEDSNAQFSCRFLAIVGCFGTTGIDWCSIVSPQIEFCNVYHNRMDESHAVLYTEGTGMFIRCCIFSNNSCDVSSSNFSTPGQIHIENCVVDCTSSAFPNSMFSLPGNTFSTSTSSYPIDSLHSYSCKNLDLQNVTLSCSFSRSSFSLSHSLPSTGTDSQSPSHTDPTSKSWDFGFLFLFGKSGSLEGSSCQFPTFSVAVNSSTFLSLI
jgi:hypothetical protein